MQKTIGAEVRSIHAVYLIDAVDTLMDSQLDTMFAQEFADLLGDSIRLTKNHGVLAPGNALLNCLKKTILLLFLRLA